MCTFEPTNISAEQFRRPKAGTETSELSHVIEQMPIGQVVAIRLDRPMTYVAARQGCVRAARRRGLKACARFPRKPGSGLRDHDPIDQFELLLFEPGARS